MINRNNICFLLLNAYKRRDRARGREEQQRTVVQYTPVAQIRAIQHIIRAN